MRFAAQLSIFRFNITLLRTLLFLNALAFVYAACRSVVFLGDVTVPEGAIVYAVEGLLTGNWPLYRDYSVPPYGTTPYTPLFYLISAALALATSKSVYAIYICCRLLTLAVTFGAAFFVHKIGLLLKDDAKVPSLFFLPFTILVLIAWGFAARPDMLAVMLSLAGVYTYLRRPQSCCAICCSALSLACAWAAKQSFVAAPIAVFLALLCARQWKNGTLFVLTYLTSVAVIAAVAQYTSGGWFFANILTANATTLHMHQMVEIAVYSCFTLAPAVTVPMLLGGAIYFKAIASRSDIRCIMLYLAVSFLLNTAACMKEGAYYNYMLEPLFVAAIMAVLALQHMLSQKHISWMVPPLLLAALTFSYYADWHGDGALEHAFSGDIPGENASIESILAKINAMPGDVLISRSMLAVRSIKPVLATDLFNTRYLEEKGKLSTKALADRIQRRELSAIVAPKACDPSVPQCGYWPPRLREAILEQYELGETLYGHAFWYPKRR